MAAKVSPSTIDRIVSDVLECVANLKVQFGDENIPVADDSLFVQKLCSKIEFLLQHGLKEKTSIFGNKKDYWDYFCQCLASRKCVHDGIRYVKLKSEVKTSRGQGRAFLRFCLMHGCLADSLQQCFVHEATRDWYQEWALPLQTEKCSSLICALYDLSEVTFDLSPDCFDLDTTWPTFSRRTFDQRFTWRPPSRSVSISSLNSQIQMEHPLGQTSGRDPQSEKVLDNLSDLSEDNESLKMELDQSELERKRLQQEVLDLREGEAQLRLLIQQLQASKSQISQEKAEQSSHSLENGFVPEESVTESTTVSELESENRELERNLAACELHISTLLNEKEQMTSVMNESKPAVERLEEQNSILRKELEGFRNESEISSEQLSSLSDTVMQLEKELLVSQQNLQEVETERAELLGWLEKMQIDNTKDVSVSPRKEDVCDGISQLINRNEETNALGETERLKRRAKESRTQLEKRIRSSQKAEHKLLEAERTIKRLEHQIAELSNKPSDLSLVSKITDLEMNNIRLLQELQSTTNDLQYKMTSLCSEKDELSKTVKKLEEKNEQLVSQLYEKNDTISKAGKQIGQFEQMTTVLKPIQGQQDVVATELNIQSSQLIHSCEKLNLDLKALASVLFCIAKGNYVTLDQKENNEEEVTENSEAENISQSETVSIVTPVTNSAKTLTKLKSLLEKNERAEMIVQTCKLLCGDLIVLARQHKKKLALEHFDVQGTRAVVENLTQEHKKLRTAEAILKHELGEKKKLLTSLRSQVESTREEWNRNRIRTAQSELDWHNLREEFASRHKQSSEESGYAEDKLIEGSSSEDTTEDSDLSEASSAPPTDSVNGTVASTSQAFTSSSAVPSTSPSSSSDTTDSSRPRSRLDILEEQYQLLYSSLLRSSKRSEALEKRLEVILGNSDSRYSSRSRSRGATVENSSSDQNPSVTVVQEASQLNEDLNESNSDLSNEENEELTRPDSEELFETDDNMNILTNGEGLCSFNEDTTDEVDKDASSAQEPMSDYRKRTLENIVSRLREEKSTRNAKEADMKAEIQVLLTEKLELERKVLSLQQEKQLVWSKESEFRKRAEFIFRQERESFESKLSSLSQERALLLKEREELVRKVVSTEEQAQDAERALEENAQESSEKLSALRHQIETLKFQMSAEAIKYERALKHYDEQESGLMELKDRISSQEQIINSLEEALREIREERRSEQEGHWCEVEELRVMLSTRDEECSAMNVELKKTMRELDETRNTLSSVQSSSQQMQTEHSMAVSRMETVLAQMKSDNESLKRQIIKLTKDKDVLWKRTETLSQLQFSPTRDRWMADSEVTECLSCKSGFSFTLRKHHCRLCGRIFCHNCANNWVSMASSSRRARVCTECYTEHVDKTAIKQTTSLATDQEGSEEEVNATLPQLVPTRAPTVSSIDSSSVDSLSTSNRRNSSPSVMEALAEVDNNNICDGGPSNVDQSFLTESSKMDFDVISDEEIARSLSACSPYSPVQGLVTGVESETQMSGTRTIQDVLQAGPEGVNGEIWVNAGGSYAIPVLLDQENVILIWEFTSDPKSVAFSVAYKEESSESLGQEVLLQMTRVQSHLKAVQGHLIAKHPGLYMLIFSNQFSKYMAKKVCYNLRIQNSYEEEAND